MQRRDRTALNEIVANNRSSFMTYIISDITEVVNSLTQSLILEDDGYSKSIIQGKIRALQELLKDWTTQKGIN